MSDDTNDDVGSRGAVEAAFAALEAGALRRFADWPAVDLHLRLPGVYTIWREAQFMYVGMSWQDRVGSKGLYGRLDSHASGRRSGDQFCIYICDRFIVPHLEPAQLAAVGAGTLSLDSMTRAFVREHLAFRASHTRTGLEARAIETAVRRSGLPSAGFPFINPFARNVMARR